jgi:hypothetical protein
VVVLQALPTTAVGKVYKPALRRQAIALKLQELFAAAAPGVPVQLEVREQGGAFVAEATLAHPADAALEQRLRDALGAIAVPTRLRFEA